MDINLNKDINKAHYPLFQSTAPELIIYGGTGAGKSYSVAQKIIINHLIGNNKKSVVVRKTRPSLYSTCYELIKDLLLQYHIPFKSHEQKMEIDLFQYGRILFFPIVNTNTTGDPASRLKSLKGVDMLWIEEANEITREEYSKLPFMLQGAKKDGYREIILSFNPIDQNHWLKRYFFDKNLGDRQKYTYKDNQFLDTLSIKKIEELRDMSENMYKIYALGEWGSAEDIIYLKYQVEAFNYPIVWYDEVFAGLDFGWEHPQVFVLMGIQNKDLYIIDTIYRTHTSNEEFGELVKDKINEYQIQSLDIYCDSARPELIDELYNIGLNVYPAEKGAGSVVAGIREVLKYNIHIHEKNVEFIKEIQGYRRKKDKNGITMEEPVKFNDDGMDAMRYGVYTKTRSVKNEIFIP